MSLLDEEKNWGCSGFMFQTFFPGWLLVLFVSALWTGFNDAAYQSFNFIHHHKEAGRWWMLVLTMVLYLAFMIWQGHRLYHWDVMWVDIWSSQFFIVGLGTPIAMIWQLFFRTDEGE